MAAKKTAAKTTAIKDTTLAAPKAPQVTGVTDGVMAHGAIGKAARKAAQGAAPEGPTGWRDPNANYAENDQSIDARMWRLSNGRVSE